MDCFSLYLQSVLKCFWSNIPTLMDVSESSLELLSCDLNARLHMQFVL